MSRPHKSHRRLHSPLSFQPFFPIFLPSSSFFHQSVISPSGHAEPLHPARQKRRLHRKHVTDARHIHLISISLLLGETHQEALKLYEKYIFMFRVMFPAYRVIACRPEAASRRGSMLIMYLFSFFLAFQSPSFRTYPARLILIKKYMLGISPEGFSGRHTRFGGVFLLRL